MGSLKKSQFSFRKNDSVGSEAAEQDASFLEDCYYDQGDLERLCDCAHPACIVVGRTGAGKTALLMTIQEEMEHVISIEPEDLSLQYLSNSTILPQLETLGVNLGLFYKLLWRHIFAVELIKSKYGLRTESETRTFLEQIWDIFRRDKEKERSINYLREWGEKFWEDTEYRVKEVTSKLESSVRAAMGAKLAVLESSASGEEKLALEEKAEVVKRLQEVVQGIQVKELTKVLKMLAESVFGKDQQRFYVLLDKLDEKWVDDHFRYRLIKALIETIGEINKNMKGVKVVVAIRRDLLDRVIHETRDAGFQEEKFEALYVKLNWTRDQMFEMLDKRVNKLVRRQYTGGSVSWSDLLPAAVTKQPTADYLIERTMYRPRDLIVFFNLCIQQAVGKPEITAQMILHAEGEYSLRRLRSLFDEWHAEFPELGGCVRLLKKLQPRFRLDAIDAESIEETCLSLAVGSNPRGEISTWATAVVEEKMTPNDFRARLASVFYRVGLLGLKLEAATAVSWSFLHTPSVPIAAIRDDTAATVCPVFYRALAVNLASGGK